MRRAPLWGAMYGLVDKSGSVDGLNVVVNRTVDLVAYWAVQGVVIWAVGDAVKKDSEHPVLEDFLRSARLI